MADINARLKRALDGPAPQHQKGSGFVITGEDNPLPTADYGMTEGGLWIPKRVSDDGAQHTQVTGSDVEVERFENEFSEDIPKGITFSKYFSAPDGYNYFSLVFVVNSGEINLIKYVPSLSISLAYSRFSKAIENFGDLSSPFPTMISFTELYPLTTDSIRLDISITDNEDAGVRFARIFWHKR